MRAYIDGHTYQNMADIDGLRSLCLASYLFLAALAFGPGLVAAFLIVFWHGHSGSFAVRRELCEGYRVFYGKQFKLK